MCAYSMLTRNGIHFFSPSKYRNLRFVNIVHVCVCEGMREKWKKNSSANVRMGGMRKRRLNSRNPSSISKIGRSSNKWLVYVSAVSVWQLVIFDCVSTLIMCVPVRMLMLFFIGISNRQMQQMFDTQNAARWLNMIRLQCILHARHLRSHFDRLCFVLGFRYERWLHSFPFFNANCSHFFFLRHYISGCSTATHCPLSLCFSFFMLITQSKNLSGPMCAYTHTINK